MQVDVFFGKWPLALGYLKFSCMSVCVWGGLGVGMGVGRMRQLSPTSIEGEEGAKIEKFPMHASKTLHH